MHLTNLPGTIRDRIGKELFWICLSAVSFHVAYAGDYLGAITAVYLYGLIQLAHSSSWRRAFYGGLTVGLLIAVGRLEFFWRIFSAGAIALWLVYAFWIGLFVALSRLLFLRLPAPWPWLALPIVWSGLEYFRSELYYLRFSWLSPGFAFPGEPASLLLHSLGIYGIGMLLTAIASAADYLGNLYRSRMAPAALIGTAAVALGIVGTARLNPSLPANTQHVRIAGVQAEFPTEKQALLNLEELLRKHPEAQIAVLSEYTFQGPVPERIRDWCRKHSRYLIAGGKEPAGNDFYNTAYVVSPEGEIVFSQVKSVPIQFFKDGLPAPSQQVWSSPWGKIGICICYDLSYSRVTDRLIEQGAQLLIVPTMDVADWGEAQHRLHGRVAPARAGEYGIPIFRLASSGISQSVDGSGRVIGNAPFPGDGAVLASDITVLAAGTLPLDRWVSPLSVFLVPALVVVCLFRGAALSKWRPGEKKPRNEIPPQQEQRQI